MTDPSAAPDQSQGEAESRPSSDSVTRGFFFSDLRGYTDFVERHGAASAADLLLRYRGIVRGEIDRFQGAEIRTEGDSFYVVFGSVSAAVRCALAIAAAARAASSERPGEAIRVGIGIHAGETVETPDGYVGSPVNIAARLCALAAPGEVLVSETVRALTQTLLPVRFAPRGRHRLKGIGDPVVVYAVEPIEPMAGYWSGGRRMRGRYLIGAMAAALAGLALIGWFALRPTEALPGDSWTIGVTLPLTGDFRSFAEQARLAVQLAVDEANAAGGIGGARMVLDVRDDGEDPVVGAEAATALVADPSVVAMVGPLFSFVAREQIPITNAAGLLQCGISATDAALTKPEAGAIELRAANPTRINFVRLAAAADIEALAAASFAFNDLDARRVLVVDDTGQQGRAIADDFEQAFTDLGGQVVRRALNPGAEPVDVLDPLSAGPDAPTLVFFGGFNYTGAPELRRAMVAEGHGELPFLSWEGVWADPGDEFSFIGLAGDAAAGSYVSRPSVGTVHAGFEERYRAAYGTVPRGSLDQYVGAAYACTEIVLEALSEVAKTEPTAENLRERVRAYVVAPAHRFQTVLGTVGFDANGDSTQQVVTFYRVDPSAAGGSGDWVITKQQDFGPAS